jgi:hypothetical protein
VAVNDRMRKGALADTASHGGPRVWQWWVTPTAEARRYSASGSGIAKAMNSVSRRPVIRRGLNALRSMVVVRANVGRRHDP